MGLFVLAVLASGLVAAGAHADPRPQGETIAIPWHVQGETAGNLFAPLDDDFLTAEADSEAYTNSDLFNFLYWSPGEDITFADDAHLLFAGKLTQFYFFFAQPVRTGTRFTIAFYANDPDDSAVGPLQAGPYELGPYVPGAHVVHYTVPGDKVVIGPDVWFAVTIHNPSAGLALANPPRVGTTHPVFYDFGAGGLRTFEGAPGNFYLRIKVIPTALPVQQVTWSAVKALFHSPHGGRGP